MGWIFHPGRGHGCYLVRATGGSLPCRRYLLAPLTGNKEGSKGLMVLRVKPTPTRCPTNSLDAQMDNTRVHSISSVYNPWGSFLTRTVDMEKILGPRIRSRKLGFSKRWRTATFEKKQTRLVPRTHYVDVTFDNILLIVCLM